MDFKRGSSSDSTMNDNAAQGATSSQGASHSPESSADLGNGFGVGSGYRTGLASSADWKDTLRPVSFGGIVFPATQVKNSSGRKLVKHVYPFRGGQDLIDLGRQAFTINVSAIFVNDPFLTKVFGKDLYPGRFEKLIAKINQGTSDELVHPVLGSIWASCESYNDTTQSTEINTVRLELTFVENGLNSSASFVGTASIPSAEQSASSLDSFAYRAGVDLASKVGLTFSQVVAQVKTAFSAPGLAQTDVAAELELARMNLDIIVGAIPVIEDPINVSAKAELASLGATLNAAGAEYLAGHAPVVKYVTTTQTTTVDIAKERYQDPGRALEIERLNSIPDPLNIAPDTELRVYAY